MRENIACGAAASLEQIEAVAKSANAHEFVQRLPDGYETILSEKGVSLSQGQRQRLAIARALLRPAPILILDEPTTGLDQENEQQVLKALEHLCQGPTTIWITHSLHQAVDADLILFLEEGRILEQGTHQSLIRSNGRYATLYQLQPLAAGKLAPLPVSHSASQSRTLQPQARHSPSL